MYFLIFFSYFVRTTDIFEYYFYAIKKTNYIFISKITSLIFIVLLQYYGVQNQLGILYFATLLIIDFLFQGIIYGLIFHFKTDLNFTNWSFSWLMAKYEILGAVISVLISHFFTNIGFIIFDSKNRNQLKLILSK